MKLVVVTLNSHSVAACRSARERVLESGRAEGESVEVALHVAADWEGSPEAARACQEDLRDADIVVVGQIFMPQHSSVILPVLEERHDEYRAVICLLSEGPVVRLTRMGGFSMGGDGANRSKWSPISLLKKLKGEKKGGGRASGQRQMRVLKQIPRLLRFIPGTAQDVRAYFLILQYWLSGSEENMESLFRFVLARYGDGSDRTRDIPAPRQYPEVGLYHPDLPGLGLTEDVDALPTGRIAPWHPSSPREPEPARPRATSTTNGAAVEPRGRPTVGVLLMRSYVLAGNTAHYDAVIRALEARGHRVLPAYAAGLDNTPPVERFFLDEDGRSRVEAVVSLTGFSLVGGPAYNDADAAQALLGRLDVPYMALQPLEFQTVDEWREDPRGLNPMQSALMVAIPELDGAIAPAVFGGRGGFSAESSGAASVPVPERVERIADRLDRWIRLRTTPRPQRRIAVTLFNFPPNGGNVGTAAYLDVFESLHRTLSRLRDEGYDVAGLPDTAAELRDSILEGNSERHGTPANVHHRIPVDDHVARETYLREIEEVWGPAPGRELTDGRNLLVQGVAFGNVFVGIQPPFGWEGDPMRLLFQGGFAPTHAFSAYYRWVREDLDAHAVLHFGTHGALEFMPGKHVGMSGGCWPERLIRDLPNLYLYAANNPSEGTLAKRRGSAVLLSYLTPPVLRAGLYKGLLDLKTTLDRLRSLPPEASLEEVDGLREAALALAVELELASDETEIPEGPGADVWVAELLGRLMELEGSLIPHGLHTLGQDPEAGVLNELVVAAGLCPAPGEDGIMEALESESRFAFELGQAVELLVADPGDGHRGREAARAHLVEQGAPAEPVDLLLERLQALTRGLRTNRELDALVGALDGGYVAPTPGGDLLRSPRILPTGRNIYAFDPWRIPSTAALREGRRQADRILARHQEATGTFPRAAGFVLWGTDNMKREGAPVAQALALMGAEPTFDTYGRLSGARLIPLEELGRPRVDVVITTSGIFRDLLPLQMRLLAQAALKAATADEPLELNRVRAHALEHAGLHGGELEAAALRVFSNADGAYGANVNQLVDAGTWQEEEELGRSFVGRKGFGYDQHGRPHPAGDLLEALLARVELTYQNLDSVELGVSDVDQYFDSLGGLARAARTARGEGVPVYLGDETRGEGRVRTLEEQIDLETRTRTLNPRWTEGMLAHGYQGVQEIESRVTNTVGWSATAAAVPQWVYREIGETYVLDPEMRERLSALNPEAAVRMGQRLQEACDRGYWDPDDETRARLDEALDELDDRLEGIEIEKEVAA